MHCHQTFVHIFAIGLVVDQFYFQNFRKFAINFVTRLICGDVFKGSFIADFLRSVRVKKLKIDQYLATLWRNVWWFLTHTVYGDHPQKNRWMLVGDCRLEK